MKQQTIPIVGINWGSSQRRVHLLSPEGGLIRRHKDECGVFEVGGDFEGSLKALLAMLEVVQADVILSGMVGSRNAWCGVSYLSCEHSIRELPQAMVDVETSLPGVRCRIVPGYQYTDEHGKPDLMRGEETQLLGALILGAAEGWFLLPGRHSKWVLVERDRVIEILTFMTGELFALLSERGTLANLMQQRDPVPIAFEAGVMAAGRGGFSHMAFGCCALVETGAMPAAHAYSYLSGLLVGAELHEIRHRTGGQVHGPVQLIAASGMAAPYVQAAEFFDLPTMVWEPDELDLAALRALAGLPRNTQ